eukprot:4913340-Alexandrium_andersonii.AAC.1
MRHRLTPRALLNPPLVTARASKSPQEPAAQGGANREASPGQAASLTGPRKSSPQPSFARVLPPLMGRARRGKRRR